MENKKLVGVKAIAAFLGVGLRTVERWLADDRSGFPGLRVGGRWMADPDEIAVWMRKHT